MGRRRGSLSFNRSVRVGRYVRINLSGRGMGFSVGVRGLRVNSGPRGTSLRAGLGGVRYTRQLGGPRSRTATRSASGCAALVLVCAIVLLGLLMHSSGLFLVLLILAAIGGGVYWAVRGRPISGRSPETAAGGEGSAESSRTASDQADSNTERTGSQRSDFRSRFRPAIDLQYPDIQDPNYLRKCTLIAQLVDAFNRSSQCWIVVREESTHNLKAAAQISVQRRPVRFQPFGDIREIAGRYRCNGPLYMLQRGQKDFIAMGVDMFVIDPFWQTESRPIKLPWNTVTFQTQTVNFVETDPLPPDAIRVGETWMYTNKDGSPDRRYHENRVIPVMQYGQLSLHLRDEAATEVFRLQLSSLAALAAVERIWEELQQVGVPDSSSGVPAAPQKDIAAAYDLLEINCDASDEDVRKAFAEQAKRFHPDRFTHLGEEFRLVAEAKMQAINAAYLAIRNSRETRYHG